uniref:Uncharacterized protein n=1 Tax=Erpetoichthys calabaricus TaxID=27687 RepID=A0A8C4SD13_ERPCA
MIRFPYACDVINLFSLFSIFVSFPEQLTCDGGEFLCQDQVTCISENWVCDGEPDCPDNSDENLDRCK